MQGLESQTAYRFLHTFHHALYSQKRYYPSHECRKIDTKTPDYFAHTRERLLEKMFTDPAPTNIENGFAFFSEYCTYLLMRDTLAEAGIIIDLAPQELEEGSVGRKGVDIILSTHHKLPKERVVLMGINVKLRKMRTNQITESHIYDPRGSVYFFV